MKLGDDGSGPIRAKGTGNQPPLAPQAIAVSARGTRDLDRDPVEILRRWPHSLAAESPPAASGTHLADDKIVLAQLALDLYRELDGISVPTAQTGCSTTCSDPACQLKMSALRGAVLEACLLVQRVVLMTPSNPEEIGDRVRAMLKLVET
ncbi:MAG: hypothetical protein ABI867_32090 [Kofleriaceae bacterium]